MPSHLHTLSLSLSLLLLSALTNPGKHKSQQPDEVSRQSSKAATEAAPVQLRRSRLAVSECLCQDEVKQAATVACTAPTSALKSTRLHTLRAEGPCASTSPAPQAKLLLKMKFVPVSTHSRVEVEGCY
eukprot:111026-Rhodomonas_salina.1